MIPSPSVTPMNFPHFSQNFGGSMGITDKRMQTDRCARLMLTAIAHNLEEAWITFFPILPLNYFVQYAPTLSKK